MSSREIAQLTGKQHSNVMRDIRNMLDAISTDSNLNLYAKSTTYAGKDGRQYDQYELDKNTCLTLLLGYDPAARMRVVKRWQELEAAQAKVAVSVRDPQIAAMILALTQIDSLRQEQQRQAEEVTKLAENVAVIEARTQPENCHFTVMGYARLRGEKLDLRRAAQLGRKCAELSRQRGLPVGDVTDPRFGRVHTYHDSVLSQVLK